MTSPQRPRRFGGWRRIEDELMHRHRVMARSKVKGLLSAEGEAELETVRAALDGIAAARALSPEERPRTDSEKPVSPGASSASVPAPEEGKPAGCDESVRDPDERVKRGFRIGIEAAAKAVAYHCDCKHANVPSIVRGLADPLNPINALPESSGEGGPCGGCGKPWMATAYDVTWTSEKHLVGVAECQRCNYPALVHLDPPASQGGEWP
jgi:hypothetical protein